MINKIKFRTCKWCGKSFKIRHHNQKYCCQECRAEGDRMMTRNRVHRWYHRNKHLLTEKQRYGLGSGTLGPHINKEMDFNRESRIIDREMRRLKIRRKTMK